MPIRLTVTDVHYGCETTEELTSDILRILLYYLKLDPSNGFRTGIVNDGKYVQTATVRKHGRS